MFGEHMANTNQNLMQKRRLFQSEIRNLNPKNLKAEKDLDCRWLEFLSHAWIQCIGLQYPGCYRIPDSVDPPLRSRNGGAGVLDSNRLQAENDVDW